jgi:hypothetical protein
MVIPRFGFVGQFFASHYATEINLQRTTATEPELPNARRSEPGGVGFMPGRRGPGRGQSTRPFETNLL